MKKGSPTVEPRSVFVVDDHPLVREGLEQLLEGAPDLRVSGHAEDVPGAFEAIRAQRPDAVIIDLHEIG